MANSKSNEVIWIEDNKRFICFLDIMGFKDMVYSNEHNIVKEKLINLSQTRKSITKTIESLKKDSSKFPKFKNCDIKVVSFSDSIVFITNEDKVNDFILLSFAIKKIIADSIKLGVPIKGAISYGYLTANFDESIFFGKPLINSFILQEEVNYYGVVLDNNAENFLNEHRNTKGVSNLFFSIKTPLKKGNVIHENLIFDNLSLKRENLVDLYKTVCGSVRNYVDNTINMFDKMEQMKKEKRQ